MKIDAEFTGPQIIIECENGFQGALLKQRILPGV